MDGKEALYTLRNTIYYDEELKEYKKLYLILPNEFKAIEKDLKELEKIKGKGVNYVGKRINRRITK